MTQDIKMAEEILKKHGIEFYDNGYIKSTSGTKPFSIHAAMQEYAALTSPASGWVKASERTPIDYLLKCLKFTAPNIACEKGVVGCMAVGRYNVSSKGWIINGRSSGDDVHDLEWLDETSLPTVEECMEYAGKAWDAGYNRGVDEEGGGMCTNTLSREQYLKSIKKD